MLFFSYADAPFVPFFFVRTLPHGPERERFHPTRYLLLVFQLVSPCSCRNYREKGAQGWNAEGQISVGRQDDVHANQTDPSPFTMGLFNRSSCRVTTFLARSTT